MYNEQGDPAIPHHESLAVGTLPRTTELTILGRLLTSGKKAMSPPLARHILGLDFTPSDQPRMRDLAERNQESLPTTDQQEELWSHVKAGHLLALLHSKARKALRKKKAS